ncbi:MAG: protoporphyrinogen oxidase HemJ [Rickettsiaceae bacterium]|nr:protoporphyrinogen oxidase HemJ [Rickettsiaceae bacterium]
MEYLAQYYDWYKALHIIAVISWMAAIFYMPRLMVYHCRCEVGSEMDKTFQEMERKLLKIIMNPAIIVTYIFGLLNAHIYGWTAMGGWFHIKMTAVAGMTVMHMMLARWIRDFATGQNKHSEKFYRIINEVPVILMIIAVIMVVVKPFD